MLHRKRIYTVYRKRIPKTYSSIPAARHSGGAGLHGGCTGFVIELLDASRARARLCCGAHAPGEWPERVGEDDEQAARVGEHREPERQADGRGEHDDAGVVRVRVRVTVTVAVTVTVRVGC